MGPAEENDTCNFHYFAIFIFLFCRIRPLFGRQWAPASRCHGEKRGEQQKSPEETFSGSSNQLKPNRLEGHGPIKDRGCNTMARHAYGKGAVVAETELRARATESRQSCSVNVLASLAIKQID